MWVYGDGISWTKWHRVSPPFVYLTNWGFASTVTYFSAATLASNRAWASEGRGDGSGRGGVLRPGHLSGKNRSVPGAPLPRRGARKRLVDCMVNLGSHFFAVALVVETLVVAGFWSLLFPAQHDCPSPSCTTVHAGGLLALLVDAGVNQLHLDTHSHLPGALAFVGTWTVSQVAWVYSGYQPAYGDVLTMRDWDSVGLIVGGIGFCIVTFFTFQCLLKKCGSPPG